MDAQGSKALLKRLKNVRPTTALKRNITYGSITSLIAFILGICPLPLSSYPLGIAYFCTVSRHAVFALIGLIPAAFFTSLSPVAYLLSVALAASTRIVFGYLIDKERMERPPFADFLLNESFTESPSLKVSSGATSVFVLCLFAVVKGGFTYYDLFGAIFSILACVATILVLGGVERDKKEHKLYRTVSLTVLSALISLSLSSHSVLGINLGLSSAFFFTVLFCSKEGILPSLLVATLGGLASGIENVPPLLIGAFSAYCVLDTSGLLAASVACIAATITGVAISGSEYMATPFLSLLLGVASFSALTKLLISRAPSEEASTASISSLIKEAESEYLKACLNVTLEELSPVSEVSMKLFDSATLIRGTIDEAKEEFTEIKDLSSAVARRLYELGFGKAEVHAVGQRCTRIYVFSGTATPKRDRLSFLKKELEEIAGFPLKLKASSEFKNGSLTVFEKEAVISYYHAVSVISKDSLCGDSAEVFLDGARQRAFAVLCDGMGSGKEAHEFSSEALALLKSLLLSGMDPHDAVATVGRSLSISNICADRELTTTLDLLCIDLYSGDATLIKNGATPSYLKRGDRLLRYSSESMPLGIFSKNRSGEISFKLLPNDVFIMVSDGISECEADSIPLLKYLDECDPSPKDIASGLTDLAKKEGKNDDLTALAVKIFPLGY